MTKTNQSLDLTKFRSRLEDATGEEYWRCLEELSEEEGFQAFVDQEFPSLGAEFASGVDRRNFLKLMGASMALAGLTACDVPPDETLVPYVEHPEEVIPGRPLLYATSMSYGRSSIGLVVESHMGRPTKIEGNPGHPASLGATDPMAQAAILQLYDPDRSKTVRNRGRIRTWSDFINALTPALDLRRGTGGRGVRILTETVVSPTMGAQLERILREMPEARWHQYDAATAEGGREGRRRALGSYQDPIFRFDKADVVLSIDRDFMASGEGHVRYARDFAMRRKVREGSTQMNRLYVAESTPSPTGAVADHTFPTRPSHMEAAVRDVLAAMRGRSEGETSWAGAVARDLLEHAGSSIVVAGEHLAPEVHELVHQINELLGNVGQTVLYMPPAEIRPVDQIHSIRSLVDDMNAGEVEVLVILGGNPVYSAPADLQFENALARVPLRVHHSLFYDETSVNCDWHLPATHFLEEWGDNRSFDGTASLVQPLIEPLYDGRPAIEVLGIFTGELNVTSRDLVRNYWQTRVSGSFESWWRTALHEGVISKESVAAANFEFPSEPERPETASPVEGSGGYELVFRLDPAIGDGRWANNGWLQEMPKPLTKITWDNAALMSLATAQALGVTNENVVRIEYAGRTVEAPVWIAPGHAPETVTLYLGYGRQRAGKVGTDLGYDANLIRTSDEPWAVRSANVVATGGHYDLASTQRHYRMHGRNLIRAATFSTFRRDPHLSITEATGHGGGEGMETPSLYGDPWDYPGYAWGMSIDTSVCTGCGGCVVACVAENNIPVVGKKEVLREREMHWLRIDRYYKGDAENPQTFHQPVPCQQCENAPCEPVCPVEATSHSDEGLNDM
ncbi:MAG: TAT-variant-translocated molybdopterin oxidoreductase, partial [Thermoanaerobaculia bacterium]|nr:TAT-variant-translocated molybdopterin oxidoreductase [Thermoanaerobaculia bacterium]